MTCRHDGLRSRAEGFDFLCRFCGVKLCTDCGVTPAHEDSPPQYCRQCSEKAGHGYAFKTEIDHDLLRARVGPDLAKEIMTYCRWLW